MQPRTKLQQRVWSLSKQLNPISKDQREWAFKNCLDHVGYRSKKNVFCLDCDNIWDGSQKGKSLVCPACGTKLDILDTRKRNYDQRYVYFAILEVIDGFQLIRYFEMHSYHKAGQKPRQNIYEVVQKWFVPDGKLTVIAGLAPYGSYGFGSQLEVRANLANYWSANKYNVFVSKIWPKSEVLPIYKRNGFNKNTVDIYPYTMLQQLLRSSKIETLSKAGQLSLLSAGLGNKENEIYKYWNSIKICIRRDYIVKDATTYLDYLDLLAYFKKDLNNSFFVCPDHLKKQHDILVAKKAIILERERAERLLKDAEHQRLENIKKRKKLAQDRKDYLLLKGKFFGLIFIEGELSIRVLKSVKEFEQEGKIHGHCVFTNAYYAKRDSLVFSATVSGRPAETVEVSLTDFRILQSRGLGNNNTEYHQEIIDLVNKNMHLIKRCMKPIKVKKVVNQQMGAVA